MQDEVNEKTIALYIKTGKLTAQTLQKAMKAILSKGKKQLAKPPQGKQSLKQLMKQNAGVSNIEITEGNIKAFESTAKKYGIDFALKKDATESPPRYLVFFKGRDADVRNAVYVLMHTFAHLMIKQMSMSSGYSSSAIRERIYFGDKMSGILLYTGSSDKEGSLGGLVELGNIDQMTNLMRDAFQEALVCTNDPECMSNLPAGKNSNGAACHSCCMISETACENGNRMLDRGLVVPIPEREECSYFKELVSELCQVEI